MFPEICERLQRAEQMDWSQEILMPADNAEGYELVNYGSFEGMYAVLIEPWLGEYENLKEKYKQYERGDISRDEGARDLRNRGGDRRSEDFQNDNVSLKSQQGNGKAYAEARLRRDHPKLYEAVQRGELSANAAAIEAGFRKKLSKFEQIVKWLTEFELRACDGAVSNEHRSDNCWAWMPPPRQALQDRR